MAKRVQKDLAPPLRRREYERCASSPWSDQSNGKGRAQLKTGAIFPPIKRLSYAGPRPRPPDFLSLARSLSGFLIFLLASFEMAPVDDLSRARARPAT